MQDLVMHIFESSCLEFSDCLFARKVLKIITAIASNTHKVLTTVIINL